MKALIVSPYLDHLGGGERYMLSVGSALQSLGYTLYLGWDDPDSIKTLTTQLSLKIDNPILVPEFKALYHHHNPLKMYLSTRPYDVVVYLSDGSIPLLGGKANLLHMQVPFHHVGGQSWKNKLKLKTIHRIIVNSVFTKRHIDQEYAVDSVVLYPPVPTYSAATPKSKLILSVGRFEPFLNVKKHDLMIDVFKQLAPSLPGWRLVLVGGSSSPAWIDQLKLKAAGYDIAILPNASFSELQALYNQAHLYWHAAGYGVDEQKNPELVEHFGISTVEAISAGTIPLVYKAGGQVEIVKNDALLWTTPEELIKKTILLASQPFSTYANDLILEPFSFRAFTQSLRSLL